MWNVPPKAHVVPSLELLGGGGTLKRWGLAGGIQVIGDASLEGNVEPQSLSSSLLLLTHE